MTVLPPVHIPRIFEEVSSEVAESFQQKFQPFFDWNPWQYIIFLTTCELPFDDWHCSVGEIRGGQLLMATKCSSKLGMRPNNMSSKESGVRSKDNYTSGVFAP